MAGVEAPGGGVGGRRGGGSRQGLHVRGGRLPHTAHAGVVLQVENGLLPYFKQYLVQMTKVSCHPPGRFRLRNEL